jgi:hypothetical protein
MDHSCLAGLDACCDMFACMRTQPAAWQQCLGLDLMRRMRETAVHGMNGYINCLRAVHDEAASCAWMKHGSLEDVEAASVGKFSGGHFAYIGVQSRRDSLLYLACHDMNSIHCFG